MKQLLVQDRQMLLLNTTILEGQLATQLLPWRYNPEIQERHVVADIVHVKHREVLQNMQSVPFV